MIDFEETFKVLTGTKGPFPWQIALYEDWFVKGEFPHSCNLPTGLGKTSVIAIWFIALMNQPDKVPRRLVYVVNRRTVVDQTTDEVEKIRRNLPKLKHLPLHAQQLAISTLRGQFADNHEWSADPARPAVICGTVDMIGSRLLFSGYSLGFKTKPLHAGFLGQDVLLVHDEAHLESAFQALLVAIEKEQQREGKRSGETPWPQLRVIELTATSRGGESDEQNERPFELTNAERNPPEVIPNPPTEPIHHVWQRQKAKKIVHMESQGEEKLADEIVRLALNHQDSGRAVLVFVRKVEDAEEIVKKLPKEATLQLTGTLRGLERDALVNDPIFQRFLPESNRNQDVPPASGTVYLVCTSAGEVGVNISGDHMVCDLSTFESMTQRFGRVNRFGDHADTTIDIVYPEEFGKKDKKSGKLKVDELDRRRQKTLELLKELNGDASPAALGKLAPPDCRAAFAPPPRILPVTDILFDAWALTTIRGKLPGRPPVEPYLHGISEWQPPDTHVAWREEVEVITGPLLERYKPEDLLEDYPLKPHELLRDRSDRVFKHLQKIAVEHPDAPAWVVDMRDGVEVTTLKKLTDGNTGAISYMTVLLPPLVGGLTHTGTLESAAVRKKSKVDEVSEADQITNKGLRYDVADEWYEAEDRTVRRRVRLWNNESDPEGMKLEREIRFENPEDEDAQPEKVWRWFIRKPEAANERSRMACLLRPHLDEVKECASNIISRLRLRDDIAKAVILAAWFHDLGKNREGWQRSLGNNRYSNEVYAKSGTLPDGTKLRPRDFLRDDYRHEFGSVLDLLHGHNGSPPPAKFSELPKDMQDLVLHLVAAHHGRGRPHFQMEEAVDREGDSKAATAVTSETPRRFARLQRKYGRWGLAYLESLVRAADYAASANLSVTVDVLAKAKEQQ